MHACVCVRVCVLCSAVLVLIEQRIIILGLFCSSYGFGQRCTWSFSQSLWSNYSWNTSIINVSSCNQPSVTTVVFLYFSDKAISSNVKIDSLMFLNVLLTNHKPEVFHPYINAIVPVSFWCALIKVIFHTSMHAGSTFSRR